MFEIQIFEILNRTYLGNTVESYLKSLLILLGFFFLGMIVKRLLKVELQKFASKTKSKADDYIVEHLQKPAGLFFLNTGIFYAVKYLTFPTSFEDVFTKILRGIYVFLIAWFIQKVADFFLEVYVRPATEKTKTDLDDHLLPILKKLIYVGIYIFATIVILDMFNFDVTSILAGLGIGGLAFALAAKDLLSNLFGGISILLDKPFKIGQRIKVSGVDGTVKEIGLRTTRIQTLDGTEVIIPNAKMTENIIENVSREEARKIVMTLGLTYDTTNAKMEKAMEIVKKIVNANENTKNEPIIAFSEFGASSLNILVIYYIQNKDKILSTKNTVNLEIKKQFEKAKIEFAFSTQTIYVKK
ncbi:mechanosensitive ion channel family protein [Candidatus Woesearchaeota archaeon]|nr:mechanosensitive ion channel family protein [Candidatus Woesearchaeota archaeon]